MITEYSLSQEDINIFKLTEFALPTAIYLPTEKQIPAEFWKGNIYTKVAESIMIGEASPPGQVSFNIGFNSDIESIATMQKCILAHLRNMNADYDYRIAAVGFMLSKILTIKE